MSNETGLEILITLGAVALAIDLGFFTSRRPQPPRPSPWSTIPIFAAAVSVPLLCTVDLALQWLIDLEPFGVLGEPILLAGIGITAVVLACLFVWWEYADWLRRRA